MSISEQFGPAAADTADDFRSVSEARSGRSRRAANLGIRPAVKPFTNASGDLDVAGAATFRRLKTDTWTTSANYMAIHVATHDGKRNHELAIYC